MWDESIPDLVDDLFAQNGPHGGPKETAMMMHIDPDLVREDKLAEARDGGLVDWVNNDEAYVHGARNFYDSIDNTENGVLGDQTDATPEKGERLHEAATDQLINLLEWLDGRRFDDLMAKPHVDP